MIAPSQIRLIASSRITHDQDCRQGRIQQNIFGNRDLLRGGWNLLSLREGGRAEGRKTYDPSKDSLGNPAKNIAESVAP
jgi:hypothetical protein